MTELILYTPNNNTNIRSYCVSNFSDNESLSPFCSNDLKIYIHIYNIIYNIYICICPIQNLTLAWQSEIRKQFFFNKWNELLREYMDNGDYCTHCTVNCTVSMTCPSPNVALRKSNT